MTVWVLTSWLNRLPFPVTKLKIPVLPEQYNIRNDAGVISIDTQVAAILEKSVDTPILKTCSPDELRSQLSSKMPLKGVPLESILDELNSTIVEYHRRNAHPGCWAYITSSGLPTDPLGHAITAALNQNVTGFHSAPGATILEQVIINWLLQLAGMPESAGGLMQGGGSLANLSALAVARNNAPGLNVMEQGMHAGPRPVLLVAETVHFSVTRAAHLLGLGEKDVISIKVNEAQQMNTSMLEKSLEALSRDSNACVIAVVATAGTTACGAIDPLAEIAKICKRYGVWLHVDAAYGGAALLSDKLRDRLRGIEQANSITIDLHKWCYMSVDCSVLLYRDPFLARKTFSTQAEYVREIDEDTKDPDVFYDLSPEVSRRFRALAVWLAFRHYGIELLGHNVLHNVECAEYLAARAKAIAELELVMPPQLSICCFRYVPVNRNMTGNEIDVLNDNIVRQLAKNGDFLLSSTRLQNRSVLRVCIRSFKTRAVHIDKLIEEVCKLGKEYV